MPPQTTPDTLTKDQILSYHRDGFIRIPGILSPEETREYHQVVQDFSERMRPQADRNPCVRDTPVFTQIVNFWHEDPGIRRITLHPNIGGIAEKLAGVPLRLWHDHILIKQPENGAPTEFHQDQPFWPHASSPSSISAWIALCDVPVERGCMTFLSGSHKHTDLPAQSTRDSSILFSACPELRWSPRVTVPLRAGDCTFHHSRCAHMASPNLTDEPRVAHVIIYMDATTTYTGKKHIVTDPLNLRENAPLDTGMFPPVSAFPGLRA